MDLGLTGKKEINLPLRSASDGAMLPPMQIARPPSGWSASPLERITLTPPSGTRIAVQDGDGRIYARCTADTPVFTVGGALGTHIASAIDAEGRTVATIRFAVDARSQVQDEGGRFADLFAICERTMRCYSPTGTGISTFRGRHYRNYVHWMLDHAHTAKGMRWIDDAAGEYVEEAALAQRADGMIWSFVDPDSGPQHTYHYWAYKDDGYAAIDGGCVLVRQPVENHCEYNFVETMHLHWQSSGDDAWMKRHVDAAVRALNYAPNDSGRWSQRFGLLKRACTIDSWDFQANDQYLTPKEMGATQRYNDKTKMVVFFGDNHGYARACDLCADMLAQAGRAADATSFRTRAAEIRSRLAAIAWNGSFFTHQVEEDDTVVRDFGIDRNRQSVMSNAYALNRGITAEQATAILNWYEDLSRHLPDASPGEWYAIYPPFTKGWGHDNDRWQYMNGGVHGHAAGELARGAFAWGRESYGADILLRLRDLAHRSDGKVRFAWTGGRDPAPPAPIHQTLDLADFATMGLHDNAPVPWMCEGIGNDLANLPIGERDFAGVPFRVATGKHAVVAVGGDGPLPASVSIAIDREATCLHLLHAPNRVGPSGVAGILELEYVDGSRRTVCLLMGKHINGWWMPGIKGHDAAIAWRGANGRCGDIGIYRAVIANPEPGKRIARLHLRPGPENGVYALVGLTLADRLPHRDADLVSFGGPDNWAGGLVLAALMEGLAGVQDTATALNQVDLSPRWTAAGVGSVAVTARYGASRGYVAYQWRHDMVAGRLAVTLTGGGERVHLRLLLPDTARDLVAVWVDGVPVQDATETVADSRYAVVSVDPRTPVCIEVDYR